MTNTDPWMQTNLAETFNAHVQHMAIFYDRASMEFLKEHTPDAITDFWPNLDNVYSGGAKFQF